MHARNLYKIPCCTEISHTKNYFSIHWCLFLYVCRIHMRYLLNLFPNAKFILMVRDGRATAHSIIHRSVKIGGIRNTYSDILQKWNKHVADMYYDCLDLDHACAVLRYEDLVLNPEKNGQWVNREVVNLCTRLFLPFLITPNCPSFAESIQIIAVAMVEQFVAPRRFWGPFVKIWAQHKAGCETGVSRLSERVVGWRTGGAKWTDGRRGDVAEIFGIWALPEI